MWSLNFRALPFDIDGTVGDDLALTITVTDSNGAPVDLASYAFVATVRRSTAAVAATFTQVVSGVDNNVLTLSLSDAQTNDVGNELGLRWALAATGGGVTQNWLAGAFELVDPGHPAAGGSSGAVTIVTGGTIALTLAVDFAGGGGGTGDLLSTNNLSDLDDAPTARTNLGVEIGVDVQAHSAALDAVAANVSVTQPVDLDAIETRVNALDAAVVLVGVWDASSGSFPGAGAAQAGESYIVSVGGTVDGVVFAANDRIVAITDNASTVTYAANWHHLDYTDQVLSVNGATGAVTVAASHWLAASFQGDVVADAETVPIMVPRNCTITAYRFKAGTAPTGGSEIYDFLIDGTTAYGTNPSNRPTIAAGATTASTTLPDTVAVSAGSYVTIKCLTPGSSTAGADVGVLFEVTEA